MGDCTAAEPCHGSATRTALAQGQRDNAERAGRQPDCFQKARKAVMMSTNKALTEQNWAIGAQP
jgi:hypothetical protein